MNRETSSIFYADDDRDDQDIFIDAALEVSSSTLVTTQSNGNELINQLKTAAPYPSVIFLDLNMPEKNGYEVLKEIKQLADVKDLPVVIFSTSNDASSINKTWQLGASLYITKPSSFSSLKSVIKYALSINWQTFIPSKEHFVYRENL